MMAAYQNKLDNRLSQPKMNSPARIQHNGSRTSLRSMNRSMESGKAVSTHAKFDKSIFSRKRETEANACKATSNSMVELSNQVISSIQKPANMRNSLNQTQTMKNRQIRKEISSPVCSNFIGRENSLVSIENANKEMFPSQEKIKNRLSTIVAQSPSREYQRTKN